MSTVKKPVATLTKTETKAAEKASEEKAAAPAKKAAAKKETTAKTTAKKETAPKAPKAATAKAKKEVKIAVQFADKSYTSEDLASIANDVWVYDYGKKASELKDVQLYVKPEESKVYYVFNNEITGDFLI